MKEYIVAEHPDFPYEESKPQELIRCKDCEHYSAFHMDCYRIGNVHPRKDDYCSWAKKIERGKK